MFGLISYSVALKYKGERYLSHQRHFAADLGNSLGSIQLLSRSLVPRTDYLVWSHKRLVVKSTPTLLSCLLDSDTGDNTVPREFYRWESYVHSTGNVELHMRTAIRVKGA